MSLFVPHLFVFQGLVKAVFHDCNLSSVTSFICNCEMSRFLWPRCCFLSLGIITKTRQYNFDPLKPHCYIVKLGFTGVYIIFLITARNINCGYSLEPPRRGGSNEFPQSMFWEEMWKISEFFIWKFSFFGRELSTVLNRHVFVTECEIARGFVAWQKVRVHTLHYYIYVIWHLVSRRVDVTGSQDNTRR